MHVGRGDNFITATSDGEKNAYEAGYSAGQLLDQGVEELSGKSLSRRIADGLFSLFNSESDISLTPKRGL